MKLYKIRYLCADGKYFIDKRVKAKDEHDARRVASNHFEYHFSEYNKFGSIPENVIYMVREAKLELEEVEFESFKWY